MADVVTMDNIIEELYAAARYLKLNYSPVSFDPVEVFESVQQPKLEALKIWGRRSGFTRFTGYSRDGSSAVVVYPEDRERDYVIRLFPSGIEPRRVCPQLIQAMSSQPDEIHRDKSYTIELVPFLPKLQHRGKDKKVKQFQNQMLAANLGQPSTIDTVELREFSYRRESANTTAAMAIDPGDVYVSEHAPPKRTPDYPSLQDQRTRMEEIVMTNPRLKAFMKNLALPDFPTENIVTLPSRGRKK